MTKHLGFARLCLLGSTSVIVAGCLIATAGVALASKPGPGSNSTAATCALTSAGVGQALDLTGSGFSPNSQYILYLSSPGGTGATTVNTDSTGALVPYTTWSYWSGTYTAQLWTEGHKSAEAASCSTTVT